MCKFLNPFCKKSDFSWWWCGDEQNHDGPIVSFRKEQGHDDWKRTDRGLQASTWVFFCGQRALLSTLQSNQFYPRFKIRHKVHTTCTNSNVFNFLQHSGGGGEAEDLKAKPRNFLPSTLWRNTPIWVNVLQEATFVNGMQGQPPTFLPLKRARATLLFFNYPVIKDLCSTGRWIQLPFFCIPWRRH